MHALIKKTNDDREANLETIEAVKQRRLQAEAVKQKRLQADPGDKLDTINRNIYFNSRTE